MGKINFGKSDWSEGLRTKPVRAQKIMDTILDLNIGCYYNIRLDGYTSVFYPDCVQVIYPD